ncbi:YDG domain-containing protein, partial [Singulisphaera rosea]
VTTQAFGVFDSKNVGTAKLVAVLGLALTGPDASNYVLIPPTTTADITPAPIGVSGIVADNKVYDATTGVALDVSQARLDDDVPPGEELSLNFSKIKGEFDSKDVGTGKSVVVTGITLDGADAANYLVIPVTTTADITAATLTVTGIKGVDKPFDGTTNATLDTSAAALQGVLTGDDVTLVTTGATGTFDTPDVGDNKTITVSGLTLAGADAGNYSLTQPTTTANITA